MKRAFIIGNPRSGTSLLRLMLNAHSQIVSPPECGFLQWWYEKYKNWTIENSKSKDLIEKYVTDVLTSKKIETWRLNKLQLIEFIYKEKPVSYSELTACIYKFYSLNRGGDPLVIIDKNNYYIHHLDNLSKIWPDAYYIYLIRDGRDVACSYMDMVNIDTKSPYKPNLPSDIVSIAKEWNNNNQKIQNFLFGLQKQESTKRWIRIRYEDLLSNTELILKLITDLFQLTFSDRMMQYVKYNDEPESTLDWKRKTLSMPDIQNIGRYEGRLSKNEINIFNNIARDALISGGYYK